MRNLPIGCVHAECGQHGNMARLVNSLPTQTEMQRGLSGQITEAARSLSQLRLLLFAQSGHSIPALFLVILVFWLAIMFASFRLFGSMNTTVLVFTFLFAVSAAGAIFLIFELDNPFTGMLQISRTRCWAHLERCRPELESRLAGAARRCHTCRQVR